MAHLDTDIQPQTNRLRARKAGIIVLPVSFRVT